MDKNEKQHRVLYMGIEANKIVLGDCLEVLKLIPDKYIDCIISDPPFSTTQQSWDILIPFEKLWEQYDRIVKPDRAIVIFASQPFTSATVNSNPKSFRYEWIWEKEAVTGHLNAKRMPMKKHENILVFSRKPHFYNPVMGKGRPYAGFKKNDTTKVYGAQKPVKVESNGDRYPVSILFFPRDNEGYHPNQKPVALLEYLIRTYTNPGEVVLDPTCGSGSTCVAAVRCGRQYIGIEQDENYHAISCERVNEAESSPKFELLAT